MSMVTAETLGRTLLTLSEEHSADKGVDMFLRFAESRGLMYLLPDVVRFLEQLAASHDGDSGVLITTAREVPKSLIERIKDHVGANGDTQHQIDESLIGGFTAITGNKLYDASIKNSLTRLKQQLTR